MVIMMITIIILYLIQVVVVMIIMMAKLIDHLVQEGVDVVILAIKVELLYHQQR